ncbi:MAG: hypothetical protein R3C26_21600 [Calditrichia bacterium]
MDADDRVLLDIIRDHGEAVNIVLALNKSDLPENPQTRTTLEKLNFPLVQISAKTGADCRSVRSMR